MKISLKQRKNHVYNILTAAMIE